MVATFLISVMSIIPLFFLKLTTICKRWMIVFTIIPISLVAWGQTQTFTNSGTFMAPTGVTSIIVECWGGGGAGGAATGNPASGGGGAGGSYASKILTVIPGNVYNVTVGAGGIGGNGPGPAGIPSWFNTTGTIYADGGAGGALASTNNSNGTGGNGSASSSIGNLIYQGGDGATGIYTSGTAGGAGGGGAGSTGTGNSAIGGTGGASKANNGGAGANGVANSTDGATGSTYGGGGSGGKANTGTNRNGGSGAKGLVVITLPYFSYGNNDPNNVNNWWTNTNGTGTHPANFTSSNQIFIIQNGSTYTTTNNWTVSGASTMVEIQNGGILRANNAITFSAATTFQIDNGGTYLHNHNTNINIFSGINIFGATSTVNYMLAGAQTVAGVSYNNLTISGSGTKTLGGNATVGNVLTLGGGTFAVGNNSLALNGPAIAGTPNNITTTASSTIVLGGTATGITLPSSIALLNNLTISNPNGVSLTASLSSGTLVFTAGILSTSLTNLLTITNTAAGSIGGASATSYINGPLARTLLAGQTSYGTPYLFPVGDGVDYRPLELLNITTGATTPVILVSQSGTGALTADETTITGVAPRNWYVQRLSGNFTSAIVRLTENGLDFTKVIGQSTSQSGDYVSVGGTNIGTSITSASAIANATLPAYFAIGKSLVTTFYSYQSGDWNSSSIWTIDPSGSLWIGASVPGPADNVVILNGRNVTINQNGKNSLSLEIRLGGTLDLQATNSHNFGSVTGQGSLKLSSGTFPGGVYTSFVAAEGGSVEYYNLNNAGISSTQLTYNNLIISNYTAGATTVFLNNASNPINYTLKGNFDLKNYATGSLTFYFGNSTLSDNLINMVVNGNFTIGTSCNIRVNNFASSHALPNPNNTTSTFPVHSLSLYGDFTNNGTVRFTGLPSPFINAYYTLGITAYGGTNYGDVQVFFKGATDNTLTCNGITDFFRLIVQKGTDQTNKLEVISSGTNNFALYGPNNEGNNNAGGGSVGDFGYGVYYKALFINYGTLKLNVNVNIPSLTEGGEDFNLLPTAGLWINGANVSSTVTGLNGTGYQAATLYGALRISSGQFSTGDAAGLVLMQYGAPSILVEGSGVLDVSQTWSATGATNIASYTQTGGTVNIRLQGEYHAGPQLGLSSTNSVFAMSGGTLNFSSNGGGTNYQLINIAAQAGNYQVSGGTVNLNLPSSGTAYTAVSSVPFYDMNLTNQTGSGTATVQWSAPSPLTILNNLTIGTNSVLDLNANTINLYIGHNFTLNGTYTPGNNTTAFNGSGGQVFSNAGTITTGLNNFALENASNTNITNNLTIRGALTINSLCYLNDQGNTISVAGNLTNSGIHTSQANGRIVLSGTGAQTIGGSGSGLFGNFAVNKTTGSSIFTSNQSITGNLRTGERNSRYLNRL